MWPIYKVKLKTNWSTKGTHTHTRTHPWVSLYVMTITFWPNHGNGEQMFESTWHVHVYFTIRFCIPTPVQWWRSENSLLCRFIWGTGWLRPTTLTSCKVGRGIQRWKSVNCRYALQRTFCVYLHSHFCGHNSTVHVKRDTMDHERISWAYRDF
jgi:hypothetical protein